MDNCAPYHIVRKYREKHLSNQNRKRAILHFLAMIKEIVPNEIHVSMLAVLV